MSAVASCFEILYQDKERNGAILDYILNLGQRYYDAFFADARYTAYLEGIKNTLIISLFAVLLGVLLGVLVAVVKYVAKGSKNPVIRFLDKVCKLYVTVIRATPVYLQIFIIANLIFTARNMESMPQSPASALTPVLMFRKLSVPESSRSTEVSLRQARAWVSAREPL